MKLRFGLAYDFRNPAQWKRPWEDVFSELLEQIVEVDQMGYDSIWITEHHFAEDGYTPSPITLLAAIAARTKNVRLSTDIMILPLYHAVRLAEDVATVDILSRGRMMLGMGMGYRDEEFAAFGQTRKERARRTEEAIDVLRGAWGEGPFSYQGRYYQLENVDVTPKPLQKPHPPLWLATASEPAARRAARFGLHVLPQGDRRSAYDPWVEELAKLGMSPGQFNVGLIKPWFVANSRDDPMWREAAQHERYRAEVYRPWILAANFARPAPGEEQPINQAYMVGSPESLVEQINQVREFLPVTDLIGWGTPPGMEARRLTPYLERFAAAVIPKFRD
jgi:alkanesulfonate monooxygenase SsuD/methylene tetrahydromethanopterin reductase-like flavin-dependent oxidoreductase (luciferase family)